MSTPDEIQNAAVELLHFHPNWFFSGMLPLVFFEQQVEKYHEVLREWKDNDDYDVFWAIEEHHRHSAFRAILSTRDILSDTKLEHYIELCQLDGDPDMALSALVDLLSWQGLSDEQYGTIILYPAFSNSVTQKII